MSFFEYYALSLFSLEALLQGVSKNNLNEKQIDAEIQATLQHAPAWKLQKGKCKVYRYESLR